MFHYVAASVSAFFGLIYVFFALGNCGVFGAIAKAILFTIAFNTGLLSSISAYRVFFHRCCKFPGPLPAKVSRFYAAKKSAENVQYYKEVAKLHATYGDFVRTGPREVSVLRRSAVQAIYGPNSECRKSTWYGQTGNDQQKTSIHMTRDHNKYRLRRRAWDRGFAIKAINTYEPRIKNKADIFMDQLAKAGEKPVDVTKWGMFFSFDVMGEIGFSKDFNNLTTGVEHIAIKGVHDHMNMLGIMSMIPWLLNMLSCIPGAASGYTDFFNFCSQEIHAKTKSWDPETYPQDLVSWLLKALKEKDVTAPSAEALEDDTRVIIVAGSETTATTLASALYFMAKYPEKQRKLQQLLDEVIPEPSAWDYEKVKATTYIDDWISETLRLRPALLNGGPRQTPARGITVDETYIPGGCNVLIPVSLIHRDPRWWQQAEEFIPERFGESREEMGTDNAPYMPFSLGSYSCPGKNLGQLSLRISISSILGRFNVSFAPGETGETFINDTLDTFTVTLPPLNLQFTPRNQG
ncbi:putative benzoate 4-monooxygenase cytochrome P450 [Massarina eburnea CBS 473.64]|uniref:Putative benzoate 4-monooxygenase cytochrome P450 n=1 Tax=Massarina eburnea CBS 473.64 TaxID=1395130 RepID=A0A6A6SDM9_9PLEO|nr:putative benzoate 4-monooxygenase cytochrome P450 [Massarina eburnea CBS 473.64]